MGETDKTPDPKLAAPAATPHPLSASWGRLRSALLGPGPLCRQHQSSNGRWLLLDPFPPATAEKAFDQHRQNLASKRDILKIDRKRQLSRVAGDGRSLVVKEFRKPGPWGRWRPDCRSWLNTRRLADHGIPVARCRAWLKHRDGRGFLILEDVGDLTLDEALRNAGSIGCQRRLLRAATRLAAWLHRARIVHGDLKLSNIMVPAESADPRMPLTLIDSDAIHFNREPTPAARAKNLYQMLDTFPPCISDCARLRFMVDYRRAAGLDAHQLRPVIDIVNRRLAQTR